MVNNKSNNFNDFSDDELEYFWNSFLLDKNTQEQHNVLLHEQHSNDTHSDENPS